MTILMCLYPFHKILSVGGVKSASRRVLSTVSDLRISHEVVYFSLFKTGYSFIPDKLVRLFLDLWNIYFKSWNKDKIYIMTDTSSLLRTVLYIVMLRLSFNFTPVIVDIRGGGPSSRLCSMSPQKRLLASTYILASSIILQTSSFTVVPKLFHHKLNFVCNPLIRDPLPKSISIHSPLDPPFILSFTGRITESKGIEILLDLLESPNCPYKLLLAGSLELTSSNHNRFLDLVNSSHIRYFGQVSPLEACEVINNSHLFVHLSTHPWEGMPNSILDAISVVTPVLASRIGFTIDLFPIDYIHYLSDLTTSSVRESLDSIFDSYPVAIEKANKALLHARNKFSYKCYQSSIAELLG